MKWYSSDNEIFNYDSIEDAVQALFGNDHTINVGDTIEVFVGDQSPIDEAQYIPNIAEHMRDQVYDEFGELSGDYPNLTAGQESELQTAVEKTVLKFLEENKLLATFYRVENVKPIKVKVTARRNEFECEWQKVS